MSPGKVQAQPVLPQSSALAPAWTDTSGVYGSGRGLASLGADIGILSETGLHTESHHTLACKGLLTRGYQAVSHGRPSRATARVGCSSPSARATPASGPTSAGTAEDSPPLSLPLQVPHYAL